MRTALVVGVKRLNSNVVLSGEFSHYLEETSGGILTILGAKDPGPSGVLAAEVMYHAMSTDDGQLTSGYVTVVHHMMSE
jgi:hypothetical protein